MRVDPNVCRLKYARERHRLSEQVSVLESRGIFVLPSTTYPHIDLVFVPRHSLRVALPATQRGAIVLPQGTMLAMEVPSLAAKAFKARFDLTDYDLRAPSVDFRDVWTDEPLQYPSMFRALEFEQTRKAHEVLLVDHPSTHRPFLCLRGVREYHEHPQHSGDDWLLYRNEMSVFSVAMSLWRVSIGLVHSQVIMQPNGLQILWNADEKV